MTSAYTPDQLSRYLAYVKVPARYRDPNHPKDIKLLTAIFVHQISTIPYDNLELHYSQHHTNSLDPQKIFAKFVGNGEKGDARGGYCMETAVFFKHILLALGFSTYTAGARIRLRKDGIPQGPFGGWVHCVNIVTLETGERYMVDVGFGGDGATKPILIVHQQISHNLGTQYSRLSHDSFPGSARPDIKFWFYEYRNKETDEWNRYYGFTELEFFEADFNIMNYWTSSFNNSNQFQTILAIKFLRTDDEEAPFIHGKVLLFNEQIKENLSGKTKLVQTFETDKDRAAAIKTVFGINLTNEEIQGIRGRLTALRDE